MSAGFWLRSIFTLAAGVLIVLGVAYEEKLIAYEQKLAERWRKAWEKNFGEAAYGISSRPQNVQPRAVSYRTRISSQIELVHGAINPEFSPERRDEISIAAQEKKVLSA